MLILARRQDETLVIEHPDGPITVTICGVERATRPRVKLGIDAPPSVRVLRGELVSDAVGHSKLGTAGDVLTAEMMLSAGASIPPPADVPDRVI